MLLTFHNDDKEEADEAYVEIEFVGENEFYVVVDLRYFYDGSAKGTKNVFSILKLRFVLFFSD